jgi:hypothetical protein
VHRTERHLLEDVLASLVRRLLRKHTATEIGIIMLDSHAGKLGRALQERNLPVCEHPSICEVVVTNASTIRGHERRIIVLVAKPAEVLKTQFRRRDRRLNIAMSRAVHWLFIIEVPLDVKDFRTQVVQKPPTLDDVLLRLCPSLHSLR